MTNRLLANVAHMKQALRSRVFVDKTPPPSGEMRIALTQIARALETLNTPDQVAAFAERVKFNEQPSIAGFSVKLRDVEELKDPVSFTAFHPTDGNGTGTVEKIAIEVVNDSAYGPPAEFAVGVFGTGELENGGGFSIAHRLTVKQLLSANLTDRRDIHLSFGGTKRETLITAIEAAVSEMSEALRDKREPG